MTKKELLLELNLLHSKIIALQDEAVDAWREAEPMSEDEEFFKEAGEKLEDLESDLSSFITNSVEDLPISAEPIDVEELDDILEEEDYEEMNEDPEGYFEKNMEVK